MAQASLKLILSELKRIEVKSDQRFDTLEAKNDARFEFIKGEFQRLEHKVDSGFSELKTEIRIVRDQTARLTEGQVMLEGRVLRLEQKRIDS